MAREKSADDRTLHWQAAAMVVFVLGYVAHFRLFDVRIQDDAFISFRYARHFVDGQGLVWNIGEHVEGYTNFLWTLLMSVPMFISDKLNPLSFARMLSSFSGYATMIVSFLFTRHLLPKSRVFPIVPPILLAGNWAFAINTMTGLETIFFSALLTIATFLLFKEQDDLRYRGSSVVYALAALTRPEAILLYLLIFALIAGHRFREGQTAKDYLLRFFVPFGVIVGAHEVFRLAYYGEWVPNTYFAKFGAELPAGMPTRSNYLGEFFRKGLDAAGTTLLFAFFFAAFRWRELKTRILLVGALFGILNVFLSGADFMIGFRYLIPYAPFWHLCAVLGIEAFSQRARNGPSVQTVEKAVIVAALASSLSRYWYSRDKLAPFEQLRYRVSSDSNTVLGKWLGENLPKDAIVIARDIGEIGYLSDLQMVDMTGLTDRTIARKPGNVLDRAIDVDDIFARNPSAFVFVSKLPGPVLPVRRAAAFATTPSIIRLLDDPRMQDQFVFFARYPSYDYVRKNDNGGWSGISRENVRGQDMPNSYFLELYLRKDLAESLRK